MTLAPQEMTVSEWMLRVLRFDFSSYNTVEQELNRRHVDIRGRIIVSEGKAFLSNKREKSPV